MAIDIAKYDEADRFGPVTKLQRTVDTPMPGYSTEENRMVAYRVGDYVVNVQKVGTRGWSVTRYEGDDLDGRRAYFDEEEAHTVAREMVEEVAADE